jgi:hypothetical protein
MLKRILAAFGASQVSSVRTSPRIERLEGRQLLSGGPQLTGVELLGSADACTGVVFTFDRALDPARATDVRAYVVGRTPPSGSDDDGSGILGSILGFARPLPQPIKHGKVQFADADYDGATHSVTLTPQTPFKAWKYFRLTRIRGAGTYAITDTAGNAFDGNGNGVGGDDALITWRTRKGKQVHFVDGDGDRVTLSLRGPGKLFVTQRKRGNPTPMVFVENTNAKSSLTGKVVASGQGDGVVDLSQLSGISGAAATILSNSAFRVENVLP